jgi:hypothetical protein
VCNSDAGAVAVEPGHAKGARSGPAGVSSPDEPGPRDHKGPCGPPATEGNPGGRADRQETENNGGASSAGPAPPAWLSEVYQPVPDDDPDDAGKG